MRKVLIVFTDPHLSYSPSTLNLYDALKQKFDVTILAFEPDPSFSSHRITDRKVDYINDPDTSHGVPLLKRLRHEIAKTLDPAKEAVEKLLKPRAKKLVNKIREFEGEIIAVDFFSLWCVQQAGKSAHLFSLEILEKDIYRDACKLTEIKSVIIQSEERYNYLFPVVKLKTFIVQNAPNYIETDLRTEQRNSNRLVYCGSAMPFFGIISCLEFIVDYPEYSLTIKGAIPQFMRGIINETFGDLIATRRLILSEGYLTPTELNEFLKDYYIGFVFYDNQRFESVNTFNYKTAPSGKLFQYYNAGIPVIANELPGLASINKFHAGVMINSFSSSSIRKAIAKIDQDYRNYANGAKSASKHFDFSRNVQFFTDYIYGFE